MPEQGRLKQPKLLQLLELLSQQLLALPFLLELLHQLELRKWPVRLVLLL